MRKAVLFLASLAILASCNVEELRYAETLLCRYREDGCLGELVLPESDQGIQCFLSCQVYLVDNEKDLCSCSSHLLDFLEEVSIAVGIVLYLGNI